MDPRLRTAGLLERRGAGLLERKPPELRDYLNADKWNSPKCRCSPSSRSTPVSMLTS